MAQEPLKFAIHLVGKDRLEFCFALLVINGGDAIDDEPRIFQTFGGDAVRQVRDQVLIQFCPGIEQKFEIICVAYFQRPSSEKCFCFLQ